MQKRRRWLKKRKRERKDQVTRMMMSMITRAIIPMITSRSSNVLVAVASRRRVGALESWRSLSSAAAAGGTKLAELKVENPHVDVVQYKHKNRTWSIQHVDYYSEALAIGLAENGLISGDVVLSYLPQHFSEQVRTYVAASS